MSPQINCCSVSSDQLLLGILKSTVVRREGGGWVGGGSNFLLPMPFIPGPPPLCPFSIEKLYATLCKFCLFSPASRHLGNPASCQVFPLLFLPCSHSLFATPEPDNLLGNANVDRKIVSLTFRKWLFSNDIVFSNIFSSAHTAPLITQAMLNANRLHKNK